MIHIQFDQAYLIQPGLLKQGLGYGTSIIAFLVRTSDFRSFEFAFKTIKAAYNSKNTSDCL